MASLWFLDERFLPTQIREKNTGLNIYDTDCDVDSNGPDGDVRDGFTDD